MQYTLEERTITFSQDVFKFAKPLLHKIETKSMADQLIRSATSIGANYCEANGAVSKRDFRNKIHVCKKEAQETRYWLRILENETNDPIVDSLLDEIQQLVKIFATIAEKSK